MPDSPADDIALRAAAWDARLRSHSCSAEERERFSRWLEEDRRHREVFERLQAALSALRDAGEHPRIRALRESASLIAQRRARQKVVGQWLTAAAAVAALGVGAWAFHFSGVGELLARGPLDPTIPMPAASQRIWATGLGERKTVELPDGSSATLNAATRIASEWSSQERRIHLLAGEVLFRVAKDKTRPFVVIAGKHMVTAIGTEFDVRLDSGKVQVTLLQGRVAVKGSVAGQSVIHLEPNQQLTVVNGGAPPTIRNVKAIAESAWVEGQVLFTDRALPDAVAEMNRHSIRQIVASPELSQHRVNGMFLAGNQDGFVTALTAYFPIDAHEDDQGRIVLQSRGETYRESDAGTAER